MQEGQKNREMMVLCVAEGAGAVYAKTNPVVRLGKAAEEIEKSAAFPRLEIDSLLRSYDEILHSLMLLASPLWRCLGSPRNQPGRRGFSPTSFVAEQNHRVDGESTPGGDQGSDNADAEHGENDSTQDDRILWRGLIHDG